jgi:hypothetical protein
MKRTFLGTLLLATLMGFLIAPVLALAKESAQEWDLINPEGMVKVQEMKLASRITSLEGKTVLLRWNGKPNGNIVLNRVAELLTEKVKDIKIVKAYEVAPETSIISHSIEKGEAVAKKLLSFKPDLIIASQAD